MLKRFENDELGEPASRRVSYHCTADYAKSSKAKCHVCKTNIEQNELRLALMLQDDEGYKNTAWTHFDCFWKHPETKKLDGTHEIHNFSKLKATDRAKISTGFKDLYANKTTTKKKNRKTSKKGDSDDSEDADFSSEKKSVANKVTKKSSTSNKRKRGLDDD